jgi:hypothetical protein
MIDSISQIRRFIADSFIIFSLCATGLLIYLYMYPYAYPGLTSKIIWMFVIYIILLIALYQLEIKSFLVTGIEYCIIRTGQVGLPGAEKLGLLTKRFRTHIDEDYSKYTTVELMVSGVNMTFQVLLVLFLLALLIRELSPTMITWIDMNYFLILVVIFGAVAVLTNNENDVQKTEPVTITKGDYILIGIAGVAGAVIVWYKIQDIGNISYVIAFLSGLLIVVLSILIIGEDENEQVANI